MKYIFCFLISIALVEVASAQEKNLQRFIPGLKTEFGRGFFTSFNPKAPSYGGFFYKAGITTDVRLDKKGNWYLTSDFQYDKRFLIQRDEYPYGLTDDYIGAETEHVYNLRAEYAEFNLGIFHKFNNRAFKIYNPFINVNAQPQHLASATEIIKPITSKNKKPTWKEDQINNVLKYFMPWNFSISSTFGFQRDFSWCAIRTGINIDAQLTDPQREMTSDYSGRKYKFKDGSYMDEETGRGRGSNLRSYAIGLNLQWLIY